MRLDKFDIGRIKASADLMQIVEESGVELRRSGAVYMGQCPFHGDGDASLAVYDDGHYHCYGCPAHGDAIDFLCNLYGWDFQETISYLASRAGILLPANGSNRPISVPQIVRPKVDSQKVSTVRVSGKNDSKNDMPRAAWEAFIAGHVEKCHGNLMPDTDLAKQVRGYLARQGVSEEMIDFYRIGLCPRGHNAPLPEGMFLQDKSTLYLHGGIWFPATGLDGKLKRVRVRLVEGVPTAAGSKYVGLRGSDNATAVFRPREVLFPHDCWITESEKDATVLAWWSGANAYSSIKARMGDPALLLHCLTTYDRVLVAADNETVRQNNQGDFLRHEVVAGAERLGIPTDKIKIVLFDGKDPSGFVAAHGLPAFIEILEYYGFSREVAEEVVPF